jgi:hypothetical protein
MHLEILLSGDMKFLIVQEGKMKFKMQSIFQQRKDETEINEINLILHSRLAEASLVT